MGHSTAPPPSPTGKASGKVVPMLFYAVRRVLNAMPVALGASILIFLLLHLLPGDPAVILAGPDASPETVNAVRARLGLDRPLWIQYGSWLARVVRGEFGESLVTGISVLQLVSRAFGATLELAGVTVVYMVGLAVPLGVLSAVKRDTALDRAVSAAMATLMGLPNFWLGILLILVFSVRLQWLPPSGRIPVAQDPALAWHFLLLPMLSVGSHLMAVLVRFVRSSMLEVLERDYVRTARAKGLSERRVLMKHALRNALLPVVAILSVHLGRLFAGAVVVETVFGWPGMGRLIVTAVGNRDYTVLQASLTVLVMLFILLNILTDLLYGAIDPRIRGAVEKG